MNKNEIDEYQQQAVALMQSALLKAAYCVPLNVVKKQEYFAHFVTTVQDIPVSIMGIMDLPEPSVGYRGGYKLERVWITSDTSQTDITPLLTQDQINYLGCEGFDERFDK